MTVRAAGLMIKTAAGDVLFVKRGPGSDYPGMWAFPGGRVEDGETPEEAAIRETREEVGAVPYGAVIEWTRRVSNNDLAGQAVPDIGLPPTDALVQPGETVDFTTFAARTEGQFIPTLNDEHTAWCWAKPTDPPEPLHPGARIALARLTMDELGVARAIAAGELTSPQKYHNVWLFAIRITGTGLSYRSAGKEYVWRGAENYLTDDFLARCSGLSVIWEHPPKKPILDSEEYGKRSIGAVMLPYIKGDEVWGVAKIYDSEAAEAMVSGPISTSPGVLIDMNTSLKLKTEDGSPILIEGPPPLLDHIAVVTYGVWDKGGDPAGVANNFTLEPSELERADSMAEANEKPEDRKDAGAEMVDRLLSHLDSKLKPLVDRMDAMEMADKARKDSEAEKERMDAQARRDAERDEWMKADAETCAKDDAAEASEMEEMEKGGTAKEIAADKARKARKDRMKARADAEKTEAEKKAEEDRKDAAARHDADTRAKDAQIAALLADKQKLIEGLANVPLHHTADNFSAFTDEQARCDAEVGHAWGKQAPPPMQGETPHAYSVRITRPYQRHSAKWSAVDLGAMPVDVFKNVQAEIYADAALAANSVDGLDENVLIPRTRVTDSGHRITEWRGKHTFIHGLKRPSMFVSDIRAKAS